ncbi:MAG TPA: alpha/beta hydrolase-fold protein [Streptosporangiaceae bacterium]|jgi:enterochelin esterase family protein
MSEITITWLDPDAARPAHDVLVRLVALTDRAFDAGDVSAYLMEPHAGGVWTWTADLPADLRSSYQLCPVRDRPLRGRLIDQDRWAAVVAAGVPDPCCPDRLPPGCVYGNPDAPASVLSLPGALPQPWAGHRPGIARGSLARTPLAGGSLVHVYRSPGADRQPAPLLVVFDGQRLLATDVAATFDNLAADRAAAPLTAVVVESIRGSAPRGPTRISSLTVAAGLESFVVGELLPAVEERYPVTADPALRVLAGHSLGAVAALHLAARRPGLFGSVIAGSPALWWPGENGQVSGASVAAAHADHAPAGRVFLDAGSEEDGLLADARAFHDTLVKAGHDVVYREFRGGHDHACWRGSLADGIVAVLGQGADGEAASVG